MKDKRLIFYLFVAILAIFGGLLCFFPKKGFSMAENRALPAFPKVTSQKLLTGQYRADVENYTEEHFPFRTAMMSVKTYLELVSGKKEANGVFISKAQMIERFGEYSTENARSATIQMEAFAERFSGATSLLLIPTAADIYGDKLPAAAPVLSEKAMIDGIYEKLDRVAPIDCYSTLAANSERYVYYRTDSHWTSLGAHLGYTAASRQLGFTPVSAERMNVEHAAHDFRGSLYRKTMYKSIAPDTIDIYSFPDSTAIQKVEILNGDAANQEGGDWFTYPDLYFREYLTKTNKYDVFLGGNNSIVTVETNAKGGSLLIFGDSYARTMLPFLTQHYSKITLVDFRYLNHHFERYVNLRQYDQSLFCYNLKYFVQDNQVSKVNTK